MELQSRPFHPHPISNMHMFASVRTATKKTAAPPKVVNGSRPQKPRVSWMGPGAGSRDGRGSLSSVPCPSKAAASRTHKARCTRSADRPT
eukprot:2410785-Prymnesium_polylepis.1